MSLSRGINQSIESSDMDTIEMRSEKNSGVASGVSSRGPHTRTSSWNGPSIFSGKHTGSNHVHQGLVMLPSGFKQQHRRVQFSTDLDIKTPETQSNNSLVHSSQPQHQHFESHSTKNTKDIFNFNKNITPEAAKNFLKVLDKNRRSLYIADKKDVLTQKEDGDEKKKKNKIFLENFDQEDEKMAIIRKLEAKVAAMSTQIERLHENAHHLKEHVIDLGDTVKILTIENMTLKKNAEEKDEKMKMLELMLRKSCSGCKGRKRSIKTKNKHLGCECERSESLILGNTEDISTENDSRQSSTSIWRSKNSIGMH